jgi:hypothetical protein
MTAKSKPRKAPRPKPAQSSDIDERTRRRAYELYEQRGKVDGFALDDWLQAEAENTWSAETEDQGGKRLAVLTAIKLLHTVIWAFLAASILALPVAGVLQRFRWAAILSVIVLLECGVLAANGGRCPLSDLAARYTDERARHLPPELARQPQQSHLRNAVRRQRIDSPVALAEASAIIIGQRRRQRVMQVVKAGVVYFALVFGAGFVLGTIRTLWVVPRGSALGQPN